MPISMRCPGCQTRFELADDLDGKRIKCKSCGDIFRVAAPAPARKDDEDDRPRSRQRDEDDGRPPSSSRRPYPDDDRPRSRQRDEDDDRPRKKRIHPLLIAGPLALFGLIGVAVLVIFLVQSGKGKGGTVKAGDIVLASSKSCPLEVAEKDAGTLVLPDGGNTFGLLRKTDPIKRLWVFEPYDLAAGRRVGKIDLTDVEGPKAFSLSPDGKKLLLVEYSGLGWAGDHWLWVWSLSDAKKLIPEKWVPFPKNDKRPLDGAALYRAEFVANDRILTLGTNRAFYVYPLPTFEPSAYAIAAADKEALGKHFGNIENFERLQWQAAFSADRKKLAVWTGDSYTFANTADGLELGTTLSVKQMAKELWRGEAFSDQVKAGPVAFSPDGKTLAGVITRDFGSKKHLLCLWEVADPTRLPTVYPIAANQFNDAPSVYWWGNKFVVTHGATVQGAAIEGMLIDVRTGLPRRQLMGPPLKHYGFTRDGRLWYVAGEERTKPATMYVVDGLDPDQLTEADDYEQIVELGQEFFLRRLWLEPAGVLRQPTREDPPTKQRLIRRP